MDRRHPCLRAANADGRLLTFRFSVLAPKACRPAASTSSSFTGGGHPVVSSGTGGGSDPESIAFSL